MTEQEKLLALQDYTTLKKFAATLWQENASFHGAAIMIGAGFSRSAAEAGDLSKKLPLWYHFTNVLQEELGESNTTDPLRIAEEYKAFFGQQALTQLIQKEVNDLAWKPGKLYPSLLKLPWREILTTNWDTLLERAATDVHDIAYNVVNRGEDLARASSPRITKLHGTIGITDELVFTQEEYRQFPQKNAAFVNFARQVFLENELCLLGFSGDDPNFLQWAGWVRDHLSSSARRIYLVGALNLSSAKRKYLESINIAPIDLSVLVGDYDDPDLMHKAATKIFLDALLKLKPKNNWEWQVLYSFDAKLTLEEKLKVLESERISYPNWIICPSDLRNNILSKVGYDFSSKKYLDELSPDLKARVVYELMWCSKISLKVEPLWKLELFLAVIENESCKPLTNRQKVDISIHVLQCSKWYEGEFGERIEERSSSFIKKNVKYHKESLELLRIHFAYKALLSFDYEKFSNILNEVNAYTPELKIKKGGLLSQLGFFEESKSLLIEAKNNLFDSFSKDNNSIYLHSRLDFVESLLGVIDFEYQNSNKVSELSKKKKCNYWHQKEIFDRCLQKKLDDQVATSNISVAFDSGRYKDNSKQIKLSNEEHPYIFFDSLTRQLAVPIHWNNTKHLVSSVRKLVELRDIDWTQKLFLAIVSVNTGKDEILNKVISRITLASLSDDECNRLLTAFISALEFWLKQAEVLRNQSSGYSYSLGRLDLFLEVIARFSIRARPDKAIELFKYSVDLADKKIVQHYQLFGSLKNLIYYSLKSTPSSFKKEAFKICLNFPLADELNITLLHNDWPNPIVEHKFSRDDFEGLDHRITTLIKFASKEKEKSYPAIMRLIPLARNKFLRNNEKKQLAEFLWDGCDSNFPDKGFLKWTYLVLPCESYEYVMTIFKQDVFDSTKDNFYSQDNLLDISNCIHGGVVLSDSEAVDCFDALVKWKPSEDDVDEYRLLFDDNNNEITGKSISAALNTTVVCFLSSKDLNISNYEKLIEFIKLPNCKRALQSLAYFAANEPTLGGRFESLIRSYLHSSDHTNVSIAAHTIVKWCELSICTENKGLVTALIMMVSANKEASGLNILICLNKIIQRGQLSKEQKTILSNIIPSVFGSTFYQQASFRNEELVNIPLIRAELSKLAQRLLDEDGGYNNAELRKVVSEIKNDPLPEVRLTLDK